MKSRLYLLGFGRSGTSVTRRVLSSVASSKVIHEANFYTKALRATSVEEYLNGVSQKLVSGKRPSLTSGVRASKFRRRFNALATPSKNPLDWILTCEKVLFDGRYDFIGNKYACQGAALPELLLLEELGLTFKYIYIYRDVRDVCSSRFKRWGHNPIKTSMKWSRNICNWEELKKKLDGPSIDLKFERLVRAPVGTGRELSKFLSVDYSDVAHAVSTSVDKAKANIGEHKQFGIGTDDLHPEAIVTARRLRYKL
jgi:hypothetical protein